MKTSYIGKLARINLSTGEIKVEQLDLDLAKKFIGGRGLGTKMLYDEGVATVDPLSEDKILENINNLPPNKTVIMISHRLSSIYILDRILFFKNGNLVADGNHNELIVTCPEYKRMYEIQAKKFT